jgi:hypothetical protein
MSDKPLVLITWKDAQSMQSVGRWVEPNDVDALEPALAQSVGWVRRETPDAITVYSHDAGDVIGGDLCIPRVCIVDIIRLEPKR